MMMKIFAAGLGLAALTATAALASSPEEFTLEPINASGGSTIVYSPESYTSGGTIVTDPAAPADGGKFEDVDINDYLVPEGSSTSN